MADSFEVPVVTSDAFSNTDPPGDKAGKDHQSPESIAAEARAIFEQAGEDALAQAQAEIDANVQAAEEQVADAIEMAQMDAMAAIQEAQAEVTLEPDAEVTPVVDGDVEEEQECDTQNEPEQPVEDGVDPNTEDAPVADPEEEGEQPGDVEVIEQQDDDEQNESEQVDEEDKDGKESELVEQEAEPTVEVEDAEIEVINENDGEAENTDTNAEVEEEEVVESETTVTTNGLESMDPTNNENTESSKPDVDDGESCTVDSSSMASGQVTEVVESNLVKDCRLAARELFAVFMWVAACQAGLVFANGRYLADRIPGYTGFTLWLGVFFILMTLWETTGLSLGSTLNPSVAVAMHFAGIGTSCKYRRALIVILFAQLLAHGAGVWITRKIFGFGVSARFFAAPVPNAIRLGSKRVLSAAAGVEAIATFILCAAVLAMERRLAGAKATKSALTIGVVLLLTGSLADVTGAVMNPFQAGALAFFEGDWRFHGAYALGPLAGAIIAGVASNILHNRVPSIAVRPKTE